ncbi:hypothetical protein INT45_009592 [Circinella minor]|uniref:Pyrrolo-quinoline quinone repeat domain-containing protein n=1 Tax=Circinella minor TaxID=1195481 RepID=A0A8H7S7C6_9FUNG|nr:hypothetical protein INT45_009592 [Circinella minor]
MIWQKHKAKKNQRDNIETPSTNSDLPKESECVINDYNDKHSKTTTDKKLLSYTRNDILICATNGKIYALEKHTGVRIWRAEFPTGSKSIFSTGSMGGVVSIFISDQNRVIVGSMGKAGCLDLFTGEKIWVNKMKGCGYEEVGVICSPSYVIQPQQRQLTENNNNVQTPPKYYEKDKLLNKKQVVVLCSAGKCLGMNVETGEELWQFECPKGGYSIPAILVDPERGSTVVYVGCGTQLYCLNTINGQLLWQIEVTKATMNRNYMTLATPWSSRLAAEAHSSFNQFPLAQQQSENRTGTNAATTSDGS